MSDPIDVPAWRRSPALSVRVRILAAILLVTAAGLAIAGTTAYVVQRERTLSDIDSVLTDTVDDVRIVAADSAALDLRSALRAVIAGVRPATNESTLAVIDGVAAFEPRAVDFRLVDDALVQRSEAETASNEVVLGTVTASGRLLRYVFVPVSVDGDPAQGTFIAAFDLDAELKPVSDASRTYLLVGLVTLIVVGLVGWVVAGRLLRPIRALREAAARITASDVSERIPVVGHDDVSALTLTVNDMLDRLQGALTGQRQLLDDVGHELKTPITIVRGHLELMNPASVGDVVATRDLAIDELDRMGGLVRDISALAQVERSALANRRPTDISALVERVRLKAAALSAHSWVVSATADVVVAVDADKLTQALLQLAANAVSHGAPTGVIELGSTLTADAAGRPRLQLWVSDHGPGISEELLPRVFDRFQRGTRGRGPAGSGLGLAIVAAIAEAHDGTSLVSTTPGGGATFTIDLPTDQAPASPDPKGIRS
ncbi:HAMP domain-containing sensor histidine kinase [Cryobacterium sp. PH31-O1]|uniref:sensor histidine kinase n=1 Tax=Cryobacterium sp. PH31-O1 TaxID=3046306 RepID=UPI0024B97086|nr:HAMP domain-containing sensor histidine kinase [Cryobacterium sp. PH31-O1]MDJ0338236.1 HAMP domain-containing sensor histidine kinase [Cryobacterium sp. PH31-O1]